MTFQKQFYVQANGIKLHYLEYGFSGPPLLILPAFTSAAATLRFVAEQLADQVHVFVMDHRGRGLSDHRPGLSYSLDDYAADADGLLGSLGVPSAIVLGHSMGARVGLRMAASYPHRIDRLIAADPPLTGPGRPNKLPENFCSGAIQSIRDVSRGESLGRQLELMSNWTEDQINDRMKWLPTCSEESIVASHKGLQEEDIHANIPDINCPALMMFADDGMIVSLEQIAELRNGLSNPNVHVHQMSNVGHMIPWDDLDQFVSVVKHFISQE